MNLRPELFETKKELGAFLLFLLFLLSLSLLYQYSKYATLTATPSSVVHAHVLNEYLKTTKKKSYKVIKLRTDDGHIFYTTASKNFRSVKDKEVSIRLWMQHVTFLEYLRGFYARGWFLKSTADTSTKSNLAKMLEKQHENPLVARIYQALFLAKGLTHEMYERFSAFGISHLFAISGFHIGILSGVLFFLLQLPYKLLQRYYFPYRNKNRDLFFLTALILLGYMHFLNYPPSLVRAFGLMAVGFFLYERGLRVISIQTLFITLLLLICLWPPLLFSLGFWLSVLGVFYIMLFFIHFQKLSFWQQFFALPVWIYLMMLPTSLYIFGNFSVWHPFSVLVSIGFTFFYPLALLLHLFGAGGVFDTLLESLLQFQFHNIRLFLPFFLWALFLLLSFVALFAKRVSFLLLGSAFVIFAYAMAQSLHGASFL